MNQSVVRYEKKNKKNKMLVFSILYVMYNRRNIIVSVVTFNMKCIEHIWPVYLSKTIVYPVKKKKKWIKIIRKK